ncbi:MAG: hypothetical protein ACREPB_03455 [Arenimonas sp.]
MKWISIALLALGLVACSGESSGPGGKSGAAATACDAFVKNKLEGKQYKLDLTALAASLKEGTEGRADLSAPIIIEPGLTTEVKQSIQCDVRFGADEKPEVLTVNFIW